MSVIKLLSNPKCALKYLNNSKAFKRIYSLKFDESVMNNDAQTQAFISTCANLDTGLIEFHSKEAEEDFFNLSAGMLDILLNDNDGLEGEA